MSTALKYAPFVGVGVTLIVTGYAEIGISVFAVMGLVAIGHTVHERRTRASEQRMADWLIEVAQHGTKYIQNATDHDITDERDVPRLRERHDRWVEMIKAHADEYLQKADADSIAWLHSFDQRNMPGFNAAHSRIRDQVSVRVEKLRELAVRLQAGQARLKRHRP